MPQWTPSKEELMEMLQDANTRRRLSGGARKKRKMKSCKKGWRRSRKTNRCRKTKKSRRSRRRLSGGKRRTKRRTTRRRTRRRSSPKRRTTRRTRRRASPKRRRSRRRLSGGMALAGGKKKAKLGTKSNPYPTKAKAKNGNRTGMVWWIQDGKTTGMKKEDLLAGKKTTRSNVLPAAQVPAANTQDVRVDSNAQPPKTKKKRSNAWVGCHKDRQVTHGIKKSRKRCLKPCESYQKRSTTKPRRCKNKNSDCKNKTGEKRWSNKKKACVKRKRPYKSRK